MCPARAVSAGALAPRSTRGVTALRGGAPWRPTPYQVVGFVFWLVMTLAFWRVPPCCDAGAHAAAVERLRAGLPDAADTSPYVLAQAVFARLTGLSGWAALRVFGPLNLLVLLTGVGRFVRVLTARVWAPVLAVVFMAVLWGTGPVPSVGSLALMPMTANLGYPSVCATGLTFWAWALTGTRARDARPVRYVGPSGTRSLTGYAALGLLYGLVALIDPVVGLGAAAGAAALVLGRQDRWSAAVTVRWVLTGGVAVAVAGFANAPGVRQPGLGPASLAGGCWLAMLGLPALWLRARRGSWRDPLVLMTVLVGLVAVAGRFGDLVGLALVGPQFAPAVELAAARPWPVWRRLLGCAAAGGACLGFLTVQAGAVVPRAVDPVGFPQPPRWPSYDWAARYVRPGDVVLADGAHAVRMLPGYGFRLADADAYLSPGATGPERAAIARGLGVRWLLLTRRRPVPEGAVIVAWSPRTGEVLARLH